MRIIGGVLKRRLLSFPKTKETRPVTDRSKETIFNVLGTICENASVLDLFSGSGSLGIEALSRGANETFFVDSSQTAVNCIKGNLNSLSLESKGTVLRSQALDAVTHLEKRKIRFNLIFLDPPHNKGLIKKVLHHLDHSDIVFPSGIVVVGHSNKEGLPKDLQRLCHQRSIKIGQAFISFLGLFRTNESK